MSGLSRSLYRIEQARKVRLRLLDELRDLQREGRALRKAVEQTLANASEGVRATFAGEVAAASAWLGLGVPTSSVDMDTAVPNANRVRDEIADAVKAGRERHAALVIAFTQKADEMGRRLSADLAEAECGYLAVHALLESWFPDATADFDAQLARSKQFLSTDRYGDLAPMVDHFAPETSELAALAKVLDEKHQDRLYLLDGLLVTCHKLGFAITLRPTDEERQPTQAPLRVSVDTLDRGKIDFTITLDDIQSDSNMIDTYCPKEFGILSRQLEEEFGVATKFSVGDPAVQPIGRAMDERDQPSELQLDW